MRSMHDVSLANRQASIYEKKQKRCIFPTFGIAPFCTYFCIFSSSFNRQSIAFCMLNLPYVMGLSHIFPYKVKKRKKAGTPKSSSSQIDFGAPYLALYVKIWNLP